MKICQLRRKGEGNGGCFGALAFLIVIAVALYWFVPGARTGLDQLLSGAHQASDAQLILGKWKQADGILTLEFFSDGTLREGRLLDTGKGTYKLLPDQRIDLDIAGVFWGTNHATCRYTLSGDELLLTPESGSGMALRYKRVP